jgi:hypothetical protein
MEGKASAYCRHRNIATMTMWSFYRCSKKVTLASDTMLHKLS